MSLLLVILDTSSYFHFISKIEVLRETTGPSHWDVHVLFTSGTYEHLLGTHFSLSQNVYINIGVSFKLHYSNHTTQLQAVSCVTNHVFRILQQNIRQGSLLKVKTFINAQYYNLKHKKETKALTGSEQLSRKKKIHPFTSLKQKK